MTSQLPTVLCSSKGRFAHSFLCKINGRGPRPWDEDDTPRVPPWAEEALAAPAAPAEAMPKASLFGDRNLISSRAGTLRERGRNRGPKKVEWSL